MVFGALFCWNKTVRTGAVSAAASAALIDSALGASAPLFDLAQSDYHPFAAMTA
jgi:hypothetical protein